MAGNKGFKGIDYRKFVNPTTQGLDGNQGHLFDRRNGLAGAPSTGIETYQLQAEDFGRAGWSASFSADSGSKLFHSPDTHYGTSWYTRMFWSNVTVKCHGWTDVNEKSKISFRIGNCLNGNANGSYYGMGGFGTYSDYCRSIYTNTATLSIPFSGPANHVSQRVNWWLSTADKIAWNWYQAGLGNMNSVLEGDLIEITFSAGGVVQILHNGAVWTTLTYNEKWSTGAYLDHDYMAMIQSSQEGADGNYPFYDFQFTGIVTKYPDGIHYGKYKTQFDQTMLEMQADNWDSGSYTPSSVIRTGSATTSGSCVEWTTNGSYVTPQWTRQFITGSGRGGIYTMTIPSASSAYPLDNITGITDHSLVTNYNYWTNVLNWSGETAAWNTTYTPGTTAAASVWYQIGYNAAATATHGMNSGHYPMSSGSKIAFIITGSDPIKNKEIFGGKDWNYYSTTAPGAQTCALFVKMIDTTGAPINDWVTDQWVLVKYGIYEMAVDKGHAPKKLIFNRGKIGDHFCHLEVGDNYVASGSF